MSLFGISVILFCSVGLVLGEESGVGDQISMESPTFDTIESSIELNSEVVDGNNERIYLDNGVLYGIPNLKRIRKHKGLKRSLQEEIEEEAFSTPFTYIVSPITGLGQIIVNPAVVFNNISETMTGLSLEDEALGDKIIGSAKIDESNQLIRPSLRNQQQSEIVATILPKVFGLKTTTNAKKLMVATYYPDWNVNVLPPQSVQYKKYDLIYFAFALPTEYAGLEFTSIRSVQTLKRLVKYAHGNGTKVVLSVGGWSGSKYFSQVIVNETTRSIFANSIYEVVTTNNLDGVDIDWEYPGQAQDTEALLKFFLTLRSRLGAHSIISAAVTDSTFLDKSGKRTTNVSGFGEVWITFLSCELTQGLEKHIGYYLS
ncbi:glycoside hydrolase superfamily [Phakopsora pachyrhizi]|nr:glycoside hydrolase superfamily [Phakopsora pachyrhizi]